MSYKSLIRLTIFFVVAFSLGLIFSYSRSINLPAEKEASQFSVQPGQGPKAISQALLAAGLITQDRPFLVYTVLTGKRSKFYPGDYTLPPQPTIRTIVNALTDGKVRQSTLTIKEGWRITDIASAIATKTKITEAEFLAAAPVAQYEGYLFPDTYFFSPETTATEAVAKMRQQFDKKTNSLGLTSDQVILASIIEREAKLDEDRPQIAAVYLNRLKIDMAMEADPTVQYAKGSWAPITLADYRNVVSPYNTYLNKGLPPTPISNPGLASLQAAKSPASNDYYYFVHTSDGNTYYAKTLEEHNQNKRKYLR